MQLGIDHLSTEFQVIDFVYPPNSVAQFLNIFMSSNLKAVHSYVSYLARSQLEDRDVPMDQEAVYNLISVMQ